MKKNDCRIKIKIKIKITCCDENEYGIKTKKMEKYDRDDYRRTAENK